MTKVLPVLAIILFLTVTLASSVGAPSYATVAETFANTDFDQLNRFEQLPQVVRDNLTTHFRSREIGPVPVIANPGERFNTTDVVDSKYPMRRLVFGGQAPKAWFVYYEHGGRGFHYHLIVYGIGSLEPVFAGRFVTKFQGGKLEHPPSTIADLKQWFQAGRVHDDAIVNRDW